MWLGPAENASCLELFHKPHFRSHLALSFRARGVIHVWSACTAKKEDHDEGIRFLRDNRAQADAGEQLLIFGMLLGSLNSFLFLFDSLAC